jgi:hypothetical protein
VNDEGRDIIAIIRLIGKNFFLSKYQMEIIFDAKEL